MSMSLTNDLLNKGNLHFEPLSAKASRQIGEAHVVVEKSLQGSPIWLGRTVSLLTKAALLPACALTSITALVEGTAALSLAALGTLASVLTNAAFPSLQKSTVQCLAHSFNSFSAFITPYFYLNQTTHLSNALIDNGTYLLSSYLAQALLGAFIDSLRKAREEELDVRCRTVILDSLALAIRDIAKSIRLDGGIIRSRKSLSDFFSKNPADLATLQEFTNTKIARDKAYGARFELVLVNLAAYLGINSSDRRALETGTAPRELGSIARDASPPRPPGFLDPAKALVEEASLPPSFPATLPLHPVPLEIYVNYLRDLTALAFRKVYRDLPASFGDPASPGGIEADGREKLATIDGSVIMPLANYIQFLEIDRAMVYCPVHDRLPLLAAAHGKARRLTREEKGALVSKLLKPDLDMALSGLAADRLALVNDTIRDIQTLSERLHRGYLRDGFNRGYQIAVAAI